MYLLQTTERGPNEGSNPLIAQRTVYPHGEALQATKQHRLLDNDKPAATLAAATILVVWQEGPHAKTCSENTRSICISAQETEHGAKMWLL